MIKPKTLYSFIFLLATAIIVLIWVMNLAPEPLVTVVQAPSVVPAVTTGPESEPGNFFTKGSTDAGTNQSDFALNQQAMRPEVQPVVSREIKKLESENPAVAIVPTTSRTAGLLQGKNILYLHVSGEGLGGGPVELNICPTKNPDEIQSFQIEAGSVREIHFENLESDLMAVAHVAGYGSTGFGHVDVEKYTLENPLRIELGKAHRLRAKVVDGTGLAMVGKSFRVGIEIPCGDCLHEFWKATATSDSLGEFSLENVSAGKFKFLLLDKEYMLGKSPDYSLPAEMPVLLRISRGITQKVEVVDPEGKAVAGASVECRMTGQKVRYFHQGTEKFEHRGKTDGEGICTFATPESGWLNYQISHEGYQPYEKLNLASGILLRAVLQAGSSLSGNVVSEEAGRSMGEVDLTLVSMEKDGSSQCKSIEKSDFGFTGLKPGAYTLKVSARDHRSATKDFKVKVGSNSAGTIVLERGAAQSFRVLRSEGKPLANAKLEVKLAPPVVDGHVEELEYISDAEGRFVVHGLEQGRYLIKIKCEGYAELVQQFMVSVNDETLQLIPEATLELVVTDEMGEPVSKIDIENENHELHNWEKFQVFDIMKFEQDRGCHLIVGLSPRIYEFSVSAEGYGKSPKQKLEFTSGDRQRLELKLPKAELLSLMLMGLDSGESVPESITVELGNQKGQAERKEFHRDAGSGWYTDFLKTEIEHFSVRVTGYLEVKDIPLSRPIPRPVMVHLERGLNLEFRVQNENGQALEHASLRLVGENGFDREGDTDAQGVCKLSSSLAVGMSYTLSVKHEAFAPHEENIKLLEEMRHRPYRVTLDAGCRIGGRVLDAAGAPVIGAEVRLHLRQDWGVYKLMQEDEEQIFSDQRGSFMFNGLNKGVYKCAAIDEDGIANSEDIDLKVNSSVQVELKLVPALSIQGRVEDEAGTPISGATVSANKSPTDQTIHENQIGKSDSEGQFKVTPLVAGSYQLSVTKEGYQTLVGKLVEAGEKVEYVLSRQKMIYGSVKSPTGEIMNGYDVKATLYPGGQEVYIEDEVIIQDGFVLAMPDLRGYGMQGMQIVLEANAEGYSPGQSVPIDPARYAGEKILIELKEESRLRLQVLGSDGQPLSGASVQEMKDGDQMDLDIDLDEEPPSKSNAEGLLELGALRVGPLSLLVRAQGHAPQLVSTTIQRIQTAELIVRLTVGGRLSGIVRDGKGEPLQETHVTLMAGDAKLKKMGILPNGISRVDGEYAIENITSGSWYVCLQKDEIDFSFWNSAGSKLVLIEEGKTTRQDMGGVSNQPRGSLKVTVVGSHASEVNQLLVLPKGGGFSDTLASAFLKDEGFYHFENLGVGDYQLKVVGMNLMLNRDVTVVEGEELRMEISTEGATVSGRVLTAAGEKLNSGQIMMYPAGLLKKDTRVAMSQVAAYATIQGGIFTVNSVEPGSYDLMVNPQMNSGVSAEGVVTMLKDVHVAQGQNLELGDIRLEEGVLFHLTVLLPEGTPAGGALVSINGSPGFPVFHIPLRTDAEGRVSLKIPNRFPVEVQAELKGYAMRGLLAQTTELTLRLSEGGQLRVILKGTNTAGRKLRLLRENGEAVTPELGEMMDMSRGWLSDARGEANVEHLQAGTYRIEVLEEKNLTTAQASSALVEIFKNTTAEVEIQLPK